MSPLPFFLFCCSYDWARAVPQLLEYPLQILLVLRGIERALGRLFGLYLHGAVVAMKEGRIIGLGLPGLLRKYPILRIGEVILQ